MSEFCPIIWSEEPTPIALETCGECGLIEHGTRMVWGEGNPQAPIMIILDNPGAREDKEGNPYVCGTRQTLQKAAHSVGLSTQELYVTYILKRRPVRKYDKEKTREICMVHLEQQLQTKKPKLIFCLGNVAVQSFFKDNEKEVKTLRGILHEIRGFKVAVAYHPLAVRRRPNLWNKFQEDWELVTREYFQ